MLSMFPAFFAAMDDDRLRGTPLKVYLYLTKRLDFRQARAVKIAAVESDLAIRRTTAQHALDDLVVLGYLERGPKLDRVYTYSLVWSCEAPAPTVADAEPEARSA